MIAYFLGWLATVVFFTLALSDISNQNMPLFAQIDILVGFILGLVFVYNVGKAKGRLFALLSAICLPIIAFLVIIVILGFQHNSMINSKSEISPTPELIECYVNGVRTMATREDCQKLSIKPTSAPPVQQNFIPPPPPFQMPQSYYTNCISDPLGIHCTTY